MPPREVIALALAGVCAVAAVLLFLRLARERRSMAALAEQLRRVEPGEHVLVPAGAPHAVARIAQAVNSQRGTGEVAAPASLETLASNRLIAREMNRFLALLNSANEGFIALDSAQNVLFANEAAGPFLSVTPPQARGKAAKDCVQAPAVLALLNGRSEEMALHSTRTVDLPAEAHPEGKHVSVLHSRGQLRDDVPVGELLMFRDISRIKNMQKLQSEFVDSVAHELRTPLTSIRAYVEMLIDGEASDPQMKYDFYNVIYEETYRLSELIDNLLNISMMESGTAKLDETPTRLKRLLEDGVEVVRAQCEKKEIDLVLDLPDRLPTLNLDKRLFSVAFINILSNAAKYTPEKGTVTLTTSSQEDQIVISVRDTGMGIAEEELPKIFDKFFRSPAADHIQGSGVGLATARRIIQMHGGDIRVSSTLGEGSTFSIDLPRALINTTIGD
jgi:signal transduction histidine kinase